MIGQYGKNRVTSSILQHSIGLP